MLYQHITRVGNENVVNFVEAIGDMLSTWAVSAAVEQVMPQVKALLRVDEHALLTIPSRRLLNLQLPASRG